MSDEPSMTEDEIGELGEILIKKLAVQGRMVANPARRDLRGWDCLLEMPETFSPPYDKAATGTRAFIQVKATQGKENRAKIKLVNWIRMVSDSSPWFVLGVRIDAVRREWSDAYLVHIDRSWMEKALEKLTALADEPHKRTLSVSWSEEDRLKELHGKALRDLVESHIGEDPDAYRRNKELLYKTLGYNEDSHQVHIRFKAKPGGSVLATLEDAALGFQDELDVERIETTETRFGIVREPEVDERPQTVRLEVKSREGQVRCSSNDGIERIAADAKVFHTSSIGLIPAERSKFRFQVGPLNLVLDLASTAASESEGSELSLLEMNVQVLWDEDGKFSLDVIGVAARMRRLVSISGSRLELLVDRTKPERLLSATINGFAMTQEVANTFAELESAQSVMSKLGENALVSTPAHLRSRRPQFSLLDKVLSGKAPDVEIGLPGDVDGDQEQFAMIICPAAFIEQYVVFAVVALLSAPRRSGEMVYIRGEKVVVRQLKMIPQNDAVNFDPSDEIQQLVAELEGSDDLLVLQPDSPRLIFMRAPSAEGADGDDSSGTEF